LAKGVVQLVKGCIEWAWELIRSALIGTSELAQTAVEHGIEERRVCSSRRKRVALGAGSAADDAVQPKAAQVIRHRTGGVAEPEPDSTAGAVRGTVGVVVEPTEQPILNLVGDKVALGPIRRELLPLYQRWINDFAVLHGLAVTGPRPMTAEGEAAWYDRLATSQTDVAFTIYERAALRPIGNVGLHQIDHFNRTAIFGIVIGEKDCWGKGYGTEATRLLLDYAFTALGLHNVILHVFAHNQRAIRTYQRAGFREIGRRREAHRRAGQAEDVVLMDCLATEFDSPVLRRFLDSGVGPAS